MPNTSAVLIYHAWFINKKLLKSLKTIFYAGIHYISHVTVSLGYLYIFILTFSVLIEFTSFSHFVVILIFYLKKYVHSLINFYFSISFTHFISS